MRRFLRGILAAGAALALTMPVGAVLAAPARDGISKDSSIAKASADAMSMRTTARTGLGPTVGAGIMRKSLRLLHVPRLSVGAELVVTIASARACSLTARLGGERIGVPLQDSRGGKVRWRLDTSSWAVGTWILTARCGKGQARSNVTLTTPNLPPDPPVSGTATFGDAALQVVWEPSQGASDVMRYDVSVTTPDAKRALSVGTVGQTHSFSASSVTGALGLGISSVQVSVTAVDEAGQVSLPLVLEATNTPASDPTAVEVERGTYAYTMTWGSRSDDATSTQVFESLTPEGPYRLVTTTSDSSATVSTGLSDARRWVRVAHVDAFGLSSAQVPEAGMSVKPRCICVDLDAPEQRIDIAYEPGVETVTVTWGNPTDEELNEDVAGVEVRYRRADQPGNFFWREVKFTYDEPLTSAVVASLLPYTAYVFQVSTFDRLYNRTAFTEEVTVKTLKRPCFGCSAP